MLSGVSITCFAASYAVALGLEISRLLFRSGIRGAVMLGFAAAGFFAHTAFLYYRAVGVEGYPLSSMQDWYLVAAWVLTAMYLYLALYHPRNAFGVFLLPLVLGLVAAGAWLADPTPFAREPAFFTWGFVHVMSILLSVVAVLVGFATGLMYLVQARRLKQKRLPARGFRLPSLEWLSRANGRAMGVAMLMLGICIFAGMVLNSIHSGQNADRLPWYDPVVLTLLMLCWLAVSAGVSVLYRPARAGRKVAYLTVLSFVFLVLVLGAGFFFETRHWKKGDAALFYHGEKGVRTLLPGRPCGCFAQKSPDPFFPSCREGESA